MNTAEGGAITTNDDALASALRAERRFGFDQNDQNVDLGTNGKMSEICAAMGLTSLESFEELVAANRATYEQYQVELAEIPGISLLPLGDGKRNYQYIVAVVDEAKSGISRDDLLQVLQAEGILAKRYFHPGCHTLVRGDSIDVSSQLPVTEKLVRTVLVLPGGASIESHEVKGVCETVKIAVEHGTQIRDALNDRFALKNAPG